MADGDMAVGDMTKPPFGLGFNGLGVLVGAIVLAMFSRGKSLFVRAECDTDLEPVADPGLEPDSDPVRLG